MPAQLIDWHHFWRQRWMFLLIKHQPLAKLELPALASCIEGPNDGQCRKEGGECSRLPSFGFCHHHWQGTASTQTYKPDFLEWQQASILIMSIRSQASGSFNKSSALDSNTAFVNIDGVPVSKDEYNPAQLWLHIISTCTHLGPLQHHCEDARHAAEALLLCQPLCTRILSCCWGRIQASSKCSHLDVANPPNLPACWTRPCYESSCQLHDVFIPINMWGDVYKGNTYLCIVYSIVYI